MKTIANQNARDHFNTVCGPVPHKAGQLVTLLYTRNDCVKFKPTVTLLHTRPVSAYMVMIVRLSVGKVSDNVKIQLHEFFVLQIEKRSPMWVINNYHSDHKQNIRAILQFVSW